MKKIPVFYHVPKNAGTYIIGCYSKFMHYWKDSKMQENHSFHHIHAGYAMIVDRGLIVARAFILHSEDFLSKEKNHIKVLPENEIEIDLKNFDETLLKDVCVFAFVLESNGFKYRKKFLDLLKKQYECHEFIILREPFDRAVSLFSYNTSSASQHDYEHRSIVASNFRDYLFSDQFECNWLITQLLNLDDFTPITQKHFEETLTILEKMRVYDMVDVNAALKISCIECHEFDPYQQNLELDTIFKNSTAREKLGYEMLSDAEKNKFLELTLWDRKLYSTLLQYK